jgi:LysR family transcriptional regulator, transcriptional activator of nhaA
MEWLNYHHLRYFWVVAKEGGLVPAGKVLRLSHPTLSAQIHLLEDRLGERLFSREGRKLVLTEMGKTVLRYAEEIFSVGGELLDVVKGRAPGKPVRFDVGIADAVPKLIVRRLLEPAQALPEAVRLVCHEDAHDKLLARLAAYELDLVIADAPVPVGSRVRAYSHLLGETNVGFFGVKALAKRLRRGFPQSLEDSPMLLPLEHLPLRRALEQWFDKVGIKPKVVAEFEDSALLKTFGRDGVGVFPSPVAIQAEVIRHFGVEAIGVAAGVQERFYAISVERRLKHPATVAITALAREDLFRK